MTNKKRMSRHTAAAIFRAMKKAQLYSCFKLSYLLQPHGKRIEWLELLCEIAEKDDRAEFWLFKNARSVKMFLTLIRDISLRDLKIITENRFPQSWLKTILTACTQHHFQEIQTTLNPSVCQLLDKFLEPLNSAKIRFLVMMHNMMKKARDEEFQGKDKNNFLTIAYKVIQAMVHAVLRPYDLRKVLQLLDTKEGIATFAYWPRVIRIVRVGLALS